MHLQSVRRQRVNIPGSGLLVRLEEGEQSGESSHKPTGGTPEMAARAGFRQIAMGGHEWPSLGIFDRGVNR
jgi:hypothetical protein